MAYGNAGDVIAFLVGVGIILWVLFGIPVLVFWLLYRLGRKARREPGAGAPDVPPAVPALAADRDLRTFVWGMVCVGLGVGLVLGPTLMYVSGIHLRMSFAALPEVRGALVALCVGIALLAAYFLRPRRQGPPEDAAPPSAPRPNDEE